MNKKGRRKGTIRNDPRIDILESHRPRLLV